MSGITEYENLANAIILQAVKDYRMVRRCLKNNPRDKVSLSDKNEIERFLRSQWFAALTKVDGEMLIVSLNPEVNA